MGEGEKVKHWFLLYKYDTFPLKLQWKVMFRWTDIIIISFVGETSTILYNNKITCGRGKARSSQPRSNSITCLIVRFDWLCVVFFQLLFRNYCSILEQSAIHLPFPAIAHCIGQCFFHLQYFIYIWFCVSIILSIVSLTKIHFKQKSRFRFKYE